VQRNLNAGGIQAKETFTLYRGSMNYLLHKSAKGSTLFSVERKFGEDPFTGFARQGITTVGFKVAADY
jgi:hypothetical protein